MRDPRSDIDSPWKEAIEAYFPDFMSFFFPSIHPQIDWIRGYEWLDKELQQIVRDAEIGKRLADKLVKVWHADGTEAWVLIHIEVQNQREPNFSERMYVYNYRLRDRYNRPIVSLAVLGDERPQWRPTEFTTEMWGCRTNFQFPVAKLLDYKQDWSSLDANDNLFATVVMAHLKAQAHRKNAPTLKQWKLQLTRRLYEKGYDRQDILELYRFIDWLIQLPEALEIQFQRELEAYEQEGKMPYISTIERMAQQRGREEGREEGQLAGQRSLIFRLLNRRVSEIPDTVQEQIHQLPLPGLEALGEALLDFTGLEDLVSWLAAYQEQSENG